MKIQITMAALLISGSAKAQQICDFEHQCYPDGGVKGSTPGFQSPPPAFHPPVPHSSPTGQICHLMTMRFGPTLTTQVVELCSMPDDQERIYRDLAHQREIQEQERRQYVPRIYKPGGYNE